MATPFPKPQIPTRRERIPVSEEARKQARASMGGELIKGMDSAAISETPTVSSPTVLTAEIAASEPTAVLSAELDSPISLLGNEAAAATKEELIVTTPSPSSVANPSVAPVASNAIVQRKPRGRKQTATTAETTDQPLQSVHLFRGTIHEIKMNLLLLPNAPENPTNIRQYIEAALTLYEAQLRKQGKLPIK
jgi:hypothetical protein